MCGPTSPDRPASETLRWETSRVSTGLDTGDDQPHTVGCWCCGQPYPPDRMVHLGTHPEVTVCADCARFLHRRAALLGAHATPVALIRRATQTIRDQVLSR